MSYIFSWIIDIATYKVSMKIISAMVLYYRSRRFKQSLIM